MRGTVTSLTRDPAFLAVISIVIAAGVILPNPFDNEGSIDAFINNGYSLNFTNVINRYGPWYFSYRSAHLFWLWFARLIFGYNSSQQALVVANLSSIAISSWIILRPYLPRASTAGLTLLIVLSPWTIKTVATSYITGTCVSYMFVLLALLVLCKRSGFSDDRLSLAAGCVLGLIVNANTYLVVFGSMIFLAHLATPLERRTFRVLARSGAIAVTGFIATTALCWLAWSAVLVIGSDTKIADILRWTSISLRGGSWDTDMFAVAVGRAMAGMVTEDPRPSFWRMFRNGEVEVFFPLVVMAAAMLYRLWSAPKADNTASSNEVQALRAEWNSMAVTAALVVGYNYVTSESGGNVMLSAPWYFVYMLPGLYLFGALTIAYASLTGRDGRLQTAIIVVAVLVVGLYLLTVIVPDATFSFYDKLGLGKKIAWLLVVIALIAPIPLWRPSISGSLVLVSIALGSTLFLAGGYYRLPYLSEPAVVSRDIRNAQLALRDFVERTAPPPGVFPNSHPVLFWYPNSGFTISLAGAYVADYQALHAGHGSVGLPRFDDKAIAQLKAGYRREIVFMYHTADELAAAEKAFRDLGVEFDVVGNASFTGVMRSVQFTYIHITKPPPA